MWQNFGRFGGSAGGDDGGGRRRPNPILWVVVIGAILIYSQYDGSLFGEIDQTHLSRMMVPPEEITGTFALTDHTGVPRTEQDYLGTHTLIYFGYTWCPDVCPSAMLVMAQVLEDLAAQDKAVQPIFITVDPARDTVEKLGDYVGLLSADLVGLTGSEAEVGKALETFGVYYRSHQKDAEDTEYLVDHASFFYLMGPDGKFIAHFEPNQGPTKISVDIDRHLSG